MSHAALRFSLEPGSSRGGGRCQMSVLAAGARSSVPDILVVDDDSRNLLAIESLLQPIAAHIVCARSGEEALKQVLQHDFAVIVIDVHLTGMDGYDTVAAIRQRERSQNVPVIFLTGIYDQPE